MSGEVVVTVDFRCRCPKVPLRVRLVCPPHEDDETDVAHAFVISSKGSVMLTTAAVLRGISRASLALTVLAGRGALSLRALSLSQNFGIMFGSLTPMFKLPFLQPSPLHQSLQHPHPSPRSSSVLSPSPFQSTSVCIGKGRGWSLVLHFAARVVARYSCADG